MPKSKATTGAKIEVGDRGKTEPTTKRGTGNHNSKMVHLKNLLLPSSLLAGQGDSEHNDTRTGHVCILIAVKSSR